MATSQEVYNGLIARGVPHYAALGAVQGMSAESNLNPGINEIAPVVAGSRGGYGLNQWTGSRRRQFEAFAQSRGKSVDDLGVQLDFTVWELQNSEKAAGNALYGAKDAETAAKIYETRFLRPGIPHGGRGAGATNALAASPQPAPQNVLAAPQAPAQPMWQYNALQLSPFRMT